MNAFENGFLINLTQISDVEKRGIVFTGTSEFKSTSHLYPQELALIEKAVAKRQSEFATGRWCVRQCFEKLGIAPEPILKGPNGEPLWPQGVVGSISHTKDYACAAVSKTHQSVGIDVQFIDDKLNPEIWRMVLTDEEKVNLEAATSTISTAATAPDLDNDLKSRLLIFSAKESFYKCVFPITKKFISFKQVSVEILPQPNQLSVKLNVDLNEDFKTGRTFIGEYHFSEKHILTYLSLPQI